MMGDVFFGCQEPRRARGLRRGNVRFFTLVNYLSKIDKFIKNDRNINRGEIDLLLEKSDKISKALRTLHSDIEKMRNVQITGKISKRITQSTSRINNVLDEQYKNFEVLENGIKSRFQKTGKTVDYVSFKKSIEDTKVKFQYLKRLFHVFSSKYKTF